MKKLIGFVVKAVGTIVVLGIIAGVVFGGNDTETKSVKNVAHATEQNTTKKYDLKLDKVSGDNDTYKINATVTNNTDKKGFIAISIPVLDKDGIKLGNFDGTIYNVEKGQTAKIECVYFGKLPNGYKLSDADVSGY